MAKYRIEKSVVDKWPKHPWLLTYPGGSTCRCFTFKSAVEEMSRALRHLRSESAHFFWMSKRYRPTSDVAVSR